MSKWGNNTFRHDWHRSLPAIRGYRECRQYRPFRKMVDALPVESIRSEDCSHIGRCRRTQASHPIRRELYTHAEIKEFGNGSNLMTSIDDKLNNRKLTDLTF